MKLILGSASPRRLELLVKLNINPSEIVSPNIDESIKSNELPLQYCKRIAHEKIKHFQNKYKDKSKFVPEGVEGRVEYKGKVANIIYQLQGGLRSSMGYIGAKNLNEITKKAKFVKITKAGFYESMVHSVEVTQKTINFKL